MKPIINLQSGIEIDLINPVPEMIDIEDIAKGIAYKGHFAGHTPRYFSIAEHSIMVSYITEDREGLLHDAAEAYIGDMVRPLKIRFLDFKEIENRILDAVEIALKLDPGFYKSTLIKAADNVVLALEFDEFFDYENFNPFITDKMTRDIYNKYKEILHIRYLDPEESYYSFLQRHEELKDIE